MNIFQEFPDQTRGRAVLLSIKPKYADMIFSGDKRVELRRTWPTKTNIEVIVVYASSPVQKLVGLVFVDRIEELKFEELWNLSDANGGGVTYDELKSYTRGKDKAYGVMIDRVESAEVQVAPRTLFPSFTPPQFFLYLKPEEYRLILRAMFPSKNII